jgi:predicted GIY-YIG superfamily endonuclease
VRTSVIAEAVAQAPTTPGVYFLLDGKGELLYVGKATNLRRRLAAYTKDPSVIEHRRTSRLVTLVREVRFEQHADAEAALVREADLIAAFAPRFNASLIKAEPYPFLVVHVDAAEGRARFEITPSATPLAPTRAVKTYGAFAHLGKGGVSYPATRSNAGYSALLRLLWGCGPDGERKAIPERLRGTSPPHDHTCAFDPTFAKPLHDLLSGRSARLIDQLASVLATTQLDAPQRRALERDVEPTRLFYRLGPVALAQRRRAHGLDAAPVTRETLDALLAVEVNATIGLVVR